MNTCNKLARRMALGSSMTALALIYGISAAAADEGVLGEVLVTAQKRSENLQDVPSSVSVFDGEQLDRLNATSLIDYAAYLPGFNVTSGGTPGQTTLTLRGIAPVGPGSLVGTYIDDTPLGSSSNYARSSIYALDLLPDDIQRIEVLRGPQGTLYGGGSMGGLLKYTMRDPNLTQFEARVGAETFDIDNSEDLSWGARASMSAPMVEGKLGVRLSAATKETQGFTDNAFNGARAENGYEQQGARLAVLWQPSENVSVKLGGLWNRLDADNNGVTTLELTGVNPPTGEPSLGELTAYHILDEPFTKDVDYYSLSVNWDLGWGSFVSATSYSDTFLSSDQDASQVYGTLYELLTGGAIPNGYSNFIIELGLEKWTQEFRLASASDERFEWLAGVFYTEETSSNDQEVFAYDTDMNLIPAFSPFFAFARLPTEYKEVAAFADATFKFSKEADVTVGVRWAQNDQEFRQISGGAILPTANVPGDSKEDVVTFMVSPRWHLDEDKMLYARVATGYRPGGPNVFLPDVPPTVVADELINYEIGFKGEFMERRALFNTSFFYIDWDDIQQTTTLGGVSFLGNSGSVISQGVEVETLFSVTPSFRMGLNLAYTDSQIDEAAPGTDNLEGARLPRAPEWIGSLTADYSFPVGAWQGRVFGGWRYTSDQDTAVIETPTNTSYVIPSYDVFDLNAELGNERWTLRVYAKNLLNEEAYTGGGLLTSGLNQPVQINLSALQPRTIGVSVDINF